MFKFDPALFTYKVYFFFETADDLHGLSECLLYLSIDSARGIGEDLELRDVPVQAVLHLVDSNS